ncbi:MAG: two-component system cell cycle sensor histidine kinase/response regulator CckA [Myxococcota bacterium]|jgi:two-component system cell cycle sensor histidine kinase/response regulator CckA
MPQLSSDSTVSAVPALDEILAALDVGILVQGPEAQIFYSNDAATRLLGVTIDQLLGRTSFDPTWNVIRSDGQDFPGPQHPVPQAIATRKPVRNVVMGVFRPVTADRVWLLVNAVPQLTGDGAIKHVICSFTDITVQHNLEALLQEANESLEQQVRQRTEDLEASLDSLAQRELLYRSVFDALAEGTIVNDATGAIIDANPSAEQLLGLSRDQLQGRTENDPRWRLEEVDGSPLDPETIPTRVSQRDGVPVRGRILVVHRPSGERAILSVNSEPVFGHEPGYEPGGEPTMVVATFEDITRQQRTQQALEDSNARFQRISDTIPGMVLEWSWQGGQTLRLEYAGGAGRDDLGLAGGDTTTIEQLMERVHPEDREPIEQALLRARAELTPIDLRLRLLMAEHPARWFHLRAAPEPDEVGGRLYVLLLDVDRQVRLSDSIRENQKQRTIGELASGVAHNFNNMLAVILPNIEDALPRCPPELQPQLEDAIEATNSAADLVRQLLLFARSSASATHRPVDLAAIVSDVLRIISRTFDRRIRMRYTPPDTQCWVDGQASNLQQVILNLLINARDALVGSETPLIEVRIKTDAIDPEGGWRVLVTDNGSGMDDATVARLGEPFFTTKGPTQGAGMGIATAVSIAHDHGGRLGWESVLGEGSTFLLDLPSSSARPVEHTDDATAAAVSSRPHVLIIDDEDLVRRGLARVLQQQGITVTEARDGIEGCRLFESVHDQLGAVLLDLSMPKMSGEEVCLRLNAMDASVPVIIISGHVNPDETIDGAFAVVQKPISTGRLMILLGEALAQR